MSANTPHPASPRRGDLRTRHGALIGVGVLILFGVIGGMVAACGEAAAPASPTATSTPRPTATPVNPNASAPAYKAAVIGAMGNVDRAAAKAADNCNNKTSSVEACYSGLQAIHDAAVAAQTTLDQHPAPPCLKAADALYREALADYHDGITLVQRGLQSGDTATQQAGLDIIADGENERIHAAAEMSKAVC